MIAAIVIFSASLAAVAWFWISRWADTEAARIEADSSAAALKHAQFLSSLQLDRDRFEATRPVAPHEEIVAKVRALESRLNAVESWAKR